MKPVSGACGYDPGLVQKACAVGGFERTACCFLLHPARSVLLRICGERRIRKSRAIWLWVKTNGTIFG